MNILSQNRDMTVDVTGKAVAEANNNGDIAVRFEDAALCIGSYENREKAQSIIREIHNAVVAGVRSYEMPRDEIGVQRRAKVLEESEKEAQENMAKMHEAFKSFLFGSNDEDDDNPSCKTDTQ